MHDQKPRFVTFRADQDCLLAFTNPDVFGCEVAQLFAHKEKVLHVKDSFGKRSKIAAETSCDVYTMTSGTENMAKAFEVIAGATPVPKRPPVIVVP